MITYDEMGNVIYNDGGDDIATPTEFITSEWQDVVRRWKDAVDQFHHQLQIHADMRTYAQSLGPDELARWEKESSKANTIYSAIQSLQDKLSSASTWAKNTLGLASLRSMHAIPLIPIAVIAGSIAAVTAVTYSLYSYDDQLQKKWDYINAHPDMTIDEVKKILDSSGGGLISGTTSEVKNAAFWIAVAGALFVFGPKLMKMMKANHGN